MKFKNIVFLFGFALSQLVAWGQAQYVGTFFGRANFDFSVPFVFLSKHESLLDNETDLGDYFFEQFNVPFFISLELAYMASFSKEHRLIGLWKIKYNDDPVNYIFTDNLTAKLNATQFNSQNLNNFILLKYAWAINPFFDFSPSFHASFDLNRDNRLEEFTENFFNAQIYSLFLNFRMKNLGDAGSELQRMIFVFDLGYSYNYFPNSFLERSITGIPDTKEDFQSLDFSFNYLYGFYPNFFFNLVYKLNFKTYVENVVHTGDIDRGYSDSNQKDLINRLDLSVTMKFLDQGSYQIIDFTTAYSLNYLYSTYVELLEISRDFIGSHPLPDSALIVNNNFFFYQPDYKNYVSNLLGLYLKLNVNSSHGFRLGYTFSIKNFLNEYGRIGSDLNNSPTGGNVSTSGRSGGSTAINSYGVYLDEKRRDIFHTISFGYSWKSVLKDRLLYPYIGFQKSESNDSTKSINRFIIIFGMRVNYEF